MARQKTRKNSRGRARRVTVGVIAYVACVLLVDMLISARYQWPFPWVALHWDLVQVFPSLPHTIWGGFDLFKFFFWLVLPLAVCLPGMDWRYLLRGTWKRWDVLLIGGGALLGMGAMFLIPLVPALESIYTSKGNLTADQKWMYFLRMMIWNLSWLPGWEFLHRYFLLKAVQREPLERGRFLPGWRPSQWMWLAVPLSETLYHLQKPASEALGMCAFSIVVTFWCLKRRNWLLGVLLHFIIEAELLIYLTLVA